MGLSSLEGLCAVATFIAAILINVNTLPADFTFDDNFAVVSFALDASGKAPRSGKRSTMSEVVATMLCHAVGLQRGRDQRRESAGGSVSA